MLLRLIHGLHLVVTLLYLLLLSQNVPNCRFSFSYHFHYLCDGFFVFFQPKGGSILLTRHIQMQMPQLESIPDLTA